MSDLHPSSESVDALVAAFERELAAAVVASTTPSRSATATSDARTASSRRWMQLIGGAPLEQKKDIGQYANALKVAVEARWKAYEEAAQRRRAGRRRRRDASRTPCRGSATAIR